MQGNIYVKKPPLRKRIGGLSSLKTAHAGVPARIRDIQHTYGSCNILFLAYIA
jgi:hypothetical protein